MNQFVNLVCFLSKKQLEEKECSKICFNDPACVFIINGIDKKFKPADRVSDKKTMISFLKRAAKTFKNRVAKTNKKAERLGVKTIYHICGMECPNASKLISIKLHEWPYTANDQKERKHCKKLQTFFRTFKQ